ncbi:ABC transporter permease [Lysobacter sp. HDW10]|uniref:ABC transporter permease n=1 Tax=Lysobacter sp. HDW10 TaxID=2714936 RepID=UPI00140768C8|nr:ABC transporter permease [Lysobacter sp. HDW10]QIK80520.1 ABC transporter permease [Lysobacter sp. HDW10]
MTSTQLENPAPSMLHCYLLEAKYEFLRMLRTPSYSIPVLAFPLVFYLMFGVLMQRGHDASASRYLLASYGVFGAMGASLFGFGVSVAMDREHGWLTLKRAQPMPPGAYLLSKLAMAMVFIAVIAILLIVLAVSVANVSLTPVQAALLVVIDMLGALPYAAIGLYIGTRMSGRGAPAFVNLVYLPMAFLSGLWLPLQVLPVTIRTIAPIWPAWHHAQLALGVAGSTTEGQPWVHVLYMLIVAAVFISLAARRLRRVG